ncbi:hypothetical protein P9314_01985 [Paenibacillus validus]|uniref:hypothetical protein n=1 Tax=Paenibacillus TaxID=44249 RepID=UPI000FDC16C2|nr:hypothetical protein [Paenibacillus validus]MED4599479.1 hypothetical protein [Paenibacillus validus]MED4606725.1 hypothetical protein [Paenibacillus validus]
MRILYFSPIYWDDLKQRPQHIAEELSKEHEIIFVEPSISLFRSLFIRTKDFQEKISIISDNLRVYRPSGILNIPRSLDIFSLNKYIETYKFREYIEWCDVIWLGSPIFYSIIANEPIKKTVYDKMDDYAALTTNPILKKVITMQEQKLVKRADIIFVSSEKLITSFMESLNKKIKIIRNGIDVNNLYSTAFPENIVEKIVSLKEQGNIIFGYIGTVDHWFDYDAIKVIIGKKTNFHVVIVGRDNVKANRLKSKQLHYYEPVSKDKLFAVIECFDYSLYPFKKSQMLDTINPVKIYEYLACNQKVISVKSSETIRFNSLNIYANYTELDIILDNLQSIDKPFDMLKLDDFLEKNSWNYIRAKIEHTLKVELNCGQ